MFTAKFLNPLLRCFIHLLLLGCALPLNAATNSAWFYRAWQTEDGLPEHTIVGVEQAPDGYLWIATHLSLSRFDGKRFLEFTPAMEAGVPYAQNRVMLLDGRGRLWLAKDLGTVVCVEKGRVSQTVTNVSRSPNAQFRAIKEDLQGNIWISDSSGAVFRIQNGQSQVFGTNDGLAGGSTCWLATDIRGQLWFSQAGKIGIFRDGRFNMLFSLGQSSSRIAPARNGGIWLCNSTKLFHLQEGKEAEAITDLKLEPGRTDAFVSAIFEDKANGVWIGTASGGLFRYDSEGLKSIATSHPNILSILEDSEASIWVSTRGGGLNRLSPRAVQLDGPLSGLPFAAVQSACADATGALWVVGQNGVLARRTNGTWHIVGSGSGWKGGYVMNVTETDSGTLIVTRENGIFRHSNGVFEPLDINRHLGDLSIRALYPSKNGDLWVALLTSVLRLRASDGSVKTVSLPPGVSPVRAIAEDKNGDLWMGTTYDGFLFRFHADGLIDETTNILRGAKTIRCLHTTPDGSIWIGHAGQGLGRIKNGRYIQFRASQGLWDEYISQILSDDLGRLWMAGNRGLFHVDQKELEAAAENPDTRFLSVVIGGGEGLPNLQATIANAPTAARTPDGRLLMPMLAGIAIIDPDALRRPSNPPRVVIERVSVNGNVIAAYDFAVELNSTNRLDVINLRTNTGTVRITPGVKRLEIDFTALSLSAPDNVAFSYKLVGVDQEWVDARSEREVRYPTVAPGNYQFRVIARNRDGVWNEVGDTLNFAVDAHYWETAWFIWGRAIVIVCSVGGIVFFMVRARYRRKLERLRTIQSLEQERARIAQDLHDDLGAGLVEINFGSELAQDPKLGPDEVREHTQEIGLRAKEMVTALDEIVWAVNPKHDSVSSLATYFCQFAQHFLKSTSVRCHLEVDKDLPPAPLNAEQRHSLFLAFKESLSNVVKHSGATDLQLSIGAAKQMLVISVKDNGYGFDLNPPQKHHTADGVANMQRRLKQLGGRCELISNREQGTTVVFRVPISIKRHGAKA